MSRYLINDSELYEWIKILSKHKFDFRGRQNFDIMYVIEKINSLINENEERFRQLGLIGLDNYKREYGND